MKKKHPPEQYTAKPKPVALKSIANPAAHPAEAVAKTLANWLSRGGVPPSIILLHGLHFARSRKNDGIPVDTLRPQLTMQGNDNRIISEVMNVLARPQVSITLVIATWIQSHWVNKAANKPLLPLTPKKPQQSAIAKKGPTASKSNRPSTKVAVIVKKSKFI
jgi:hypothetical protein